MLTPFGRPATYTSASATFVTSKTGSSSILPFACMTPFAILPPIAVAAFPKKKPRDVSFAKVGAKGEKKKRRTDVDLRARNVVLPTIKRRRLGKPRDGMLRRRVRRRVCVPRHLRQCAPREEEELKERTGPRSMSAH